MSGVVIAGRCGIEWSMREGGLGLQWFATKGVWSVMLYVGPLCFWIGSDV